MTKTTLALVGHFGRFLVFLLAGGAIACSVVTAVACEFGLAWSDRAMRYETSSEDCPFYDKQFWNESSNDAIFLTVQLAAIVAPSLATVALLLNLVEFACCCRFTCSFFLPIVLYFAACLVQASTFFMYFRLKKACSGDDSNDCRWPIGVILSIASSASYCICSSLLSCLPEPNPYFQRSQPPRRSHVENETFEAEEDCYGGDNDLSLFCHGLHQPTNSE